jgi:hypothetical protein
VVLVAHRVRALVAFHRDAFLFLVVHRVTDRVLPLSYVVSCLRPFNNGNCPAGNSFFATKCAKSFCAATFNSYLCTYGFR